LGGLGRAARDARAGAREQDQQGHQAHQSGPRTGHGICPLHRRLLIERLARARPAPGQSWLEPGGLNQVAR
jgi:hypothetical protein